MLAERYAFTPENVANMTQDQLLVYLEQDTPVKTSMSVDQVKVYLTERQKRRGKSSNS